MPPLQILIVARQAGSANAFTPLIRALGDRGHHVDLIALSHAQDAWEQSGLTALGVPQFRDAEAHLRRMGRPNVVLTGTSEVAEDDARFWRWAEAQSVPCLAWVDTWAGYAKRFTSSGGKPFDLRPRWIGIIDDVARQGILTAGADDLGILEVGHPGLDQLMDLPVPTIRDRNAVVPRDADRFLLFVSEALSRYPDVEASLGFSERVVLPNLLHSVSVADRQTGGKTFVGVKPHPREDADDLRQFVADCSHRTESYAGIVEGDRLTLPRVADLVVGMTSILLVESSIMGAPTLSLQPSRNTSCSITDGRPGIRVSTETDEWVRLLATHLAEPADWLTRKGRPPERSLPRFVRIIEELGQL